MFKVNKIRYVIALLGLPLSLAAMSAQAKNASCLSLTDAEIPGLVASNCDFTFSAIPLYSCVLGTPPTTGIYTVKNNTPVRMRINYIRIQNNDGGPAASAVLVTAATNPCGTSLAAGASCNIEVSLTTTSLTLNRVLQVGIDSRQVVLNSPIIAPRAACPIIPPVPSTTPNGFSMPISCTVLGATTVTNTGSSIINGDVCTCPGTSITGFPPGLLIPPGVLRLADGPACAQKADELTTYNTMAALPCTVIPSELGGHTYGPGVYCFASGAATLNGVLTLSGPAGSGTANDFIFQTASTLITGGASSVVFAGGADSSQAFWIVGSSATFGTTTAFQGSVLASASITFNTNATLKGRAGVNTAAITLDTNTISPTS